MKFINKMIPQLILSIGLIFMASCNDSASNITEQDTVPEVPPANSMTMDLSIFDSGESSLDPTRNQENYQEAAQTISNIQLMMNRNVNPSLNLLKQADTTEAEQLNSTKWQWKFTNDKEEGRVIYEIRLVAEQQSEDKIEWNIFLSSPVIEQDELLYISGTSNQEVTEGVWTYHSFGRASQPSQELAELDWQTTENQNIEMGLTIIAGNSFSDSEVNYHTEGPIRAIKIDNSNSEGMVTEFNKETNVGYIQAPNYNNGEKACWDSDFKNVDCSEIQEK